MDLSSNCITICVMCARVCVRCILFEYNQLEVVAATAAVAHYIDNFDVINHEF